MTQAGYILAAYILTAIVLLGTVAAVALDVRAARGKLEKLQDEGLRRRSEVSR